MKIESEDAPAVGFDRLRRRLLLGLPGLAMTSPLALVACGGGDGDGDAAASADGGGTVLADDPATRAAIAAAVAKLPAVARTARKVTVALPSGAGVAATATNVVSANNVSEVTADGSAGVVAIDGAPQMAYVVDARGRLLLLGVIEDGMRTALDARGTAEALLLLASEACYQPPAVEIALRRFLADAASDGVVEPVRRAVEDAAGRNGVDAADAPLMAALRTATLALRGRTAVAPTAAGKDVRPLAITAHPADAVSGVSVLSGTDFNTVQLQNQFRRRTRAWIARTGSSDASGVRTPLPAPVPLTDFALDATNALSFDNLVVAVGDALAKMAESAGFFGAYQAGNFVWTPVASAPVALPVLPDTAEVADYRARVVGIGSSDGGTLTADEAKALREIVGTTLFEDIVKPFLRTVVLPMISERIPNTTSIPFDSNFNALVVNGFADLANLAIADSYFPKTIAALQAGNAKEVLNQFTTEFFSSNTFQALFEIGLQALVQASAAAWTVRDASGALVGVNLLSNADLVRQNVGRLKDALGKLARVIQIIKVTALVGDYTALAHDWTASTRVTEFEIHASKAKVSLSPKPLVAFRLLGAAGKGAVTAKVEGLGAGIPAANVFLEWTGTSRWGHLYKRGATGNLVDAFESVLTDATHDYIPSGVEVDPDRPDTVRVTAFYRNPTTNARLELGSATVDVDVRDEFTLKLLPATLQDVPADGEFSVTAVIPERLPAGATVAWTYAHGGVGSLAELPPDANLQDSAAVFRAGSTEGAATVTVSAVVSVPATATAPARSVTIKPKVARLQVKKGLKTLKVTGSWTTDAFFTPYVCAQCGPYGTPKDLVGYSVIAFALVPKVGKFTSCAVTLKGSDPYIGKSRSFGPNVVVGRDPARGEQDRGGSIWLGLSGASGTIGDNGEGPAETDAYFAGRFRDLVVTAVYTLP